MATRITARKYGGDDAYSWAIFLNGRPVVTGLSRMEVPGWKAAVARDAGVTLPTRKSRPRCEMGWTGDRCSRPLFHDGPHSNEKAATR